VAPATDQACSCCGEARTEAELARLLCHSDTALCAGCSQWLVEQHGRQGPGVGMASLAPVLPVADLPRALAHYEALGFDVESFPDGGYGFAERGAVNLHLARVDDLDPATTTSACYLYVTDADALHQEWSAAGVGGRLIPPTDTDYGLREGAHVDPDGNLLRYGSSLGEG